MTTTKLTRYIENMSHHLAFVLLSKNIKLNFTMQSTNFVRLSHKSVHGLNFNLRYYLQHSHLRGQNKIQVSYPLPRY